MTTQKIREEPDLARTIERLRGERRALDNVLRAVARGEGLQPVLDELVAEASRLCDGEYAELHLTEGDVLRAFSYYVAGDMDSPIVRSAAEQWEIGRAEPHPRDRTTLAGRVALLEDVVLMPDMLADPDYTYELPAGTRAGLGVPIILDGDLIGTMGIVRDVSSPFTEDDVVLVSTFADHAAVAIANARLLDALEQELAEQEAVAHTLRAVAEGGGLQPVLDAIVEAAKRLCRGDHAQLYLVDGDSLRIFSQSLDLQDAYDFAREHPHARDRTTVVGRVSLSGEVEHIPDVLVDPDYVYDAQKFVGYRALLGVPIAKEGELIGAIAIARDEPGLFAEEFVELVKTFADQAAIAIADARLREAVDRQLEQHRAIGDILRSVARSEGLDAVFNVVADSATRLCEGDYAALYLKEGDTLVVAASGYRVPDVHEYERENPHPIDRHTAIGRAAVTRQVVHIPDTHEDPEYSWGATRIVEYRSLLAAPILLDDDLIGAMNVVKVVPQPFGPEHIELIRTFADQAAIAIANARLIDAVRRQLEQQRAISDVFGTVARSEGLDLVFEAVVAAATQLCDGEFGGLYILEADGGFYARSHFGMAKQFEYDKEHPHYADRKTLVGRAALAKDVVHIPNLRDDPEYDWPLLNSHHAGLAVPIVVEGELMGAIGVTREPGPFSDEQIQLVKTFADQAAIAIANARLLDAVERQLDQQRAVAEVLEVVARAQGLEAVFDAVVDAVADLCTAEYGALYLEEDGAFPVVAAGGPATLRQFERENPIPPGRDTVVGRVALLREVVHVPDTLQDPEYNHPRQDAIGLRAVAGAPIFVEDELIGVIGIARNVPEAFSDEQIGLIKTFADQVAIAITNARLLDAVERQRAELSRFVSPQVAELVSSEEGQKMLAGHRAYVTSMFFDLRGFTSFTELAEPEELFEVLREYHVALGELIPRFEGTLEHFAGDGLMVFFNDPVPVEDHELKAIELALAAQQRFDDLAVSWRKRGHELGLGIGISAGYATLGRIGFEGRYDYGVLGTVTNLASRLSSAAEPGQTLISQRVYAAVEERCDAVEVGALELKGFGRPVPAYEVRGLRGPGS